MERYLIITIDAMLITNVMFARFLGTCPYLGVSKQFSPAIGMSAAVIFVLTLAQAVTWPVQRFLLDKFDLAYLQTMSFILIIAALVQLVEMVMKKYTPPLYRALGIFLPLITTNCAILGIVILSIQKNLNFMESLVFAFASAVGFSLALIIFAGVRERLELSGIPKSFQGAPIALITAGILALAFMGFAGLVKI